ncbi:MAG: repressor LexA, partial [Gammaproteobacteria bacterium]|nr:repressor LexA [Gammaproteobacteria bacterium]
MKAITKRQAEVLDFIRTYRQDNGYPPTRRNITDKFGFRSPNAAEEHLRALDRKGFI